MNALRNTKRLLTGTRIFRHFKRQAIELATINSQRVYIRPESPDRSVAESCFNGEFDSAIKAATPLQHNFIIDAGGYIGTAAIMFAKAFPSATIVCLEPAIENFAILKKNITAFPNIIPIRKALTSTVGKCRLVDRWTGQWGFSTFDSIANDCPDPATIHMTQTTTIEALLQQFGKYGIDLLKLDVEGAEHDLLKANPPWVRKTRVIFAELHDRILPGCEAVFAKAMDGRANITGSGEKVLSVSMI